MLQHLRKNTKTSEEKYLFSTCRLKCTHPIDNRDISHRWLQPHNIENSPFRQMKYSSNRSNLSLWSFKSSLNFTFILQTISWQCFKVLSYYVFGSGDWIFCVFPITGKIDLPGFLYWSFLVFYHLCKIIFHSPLFLILFISALYSSYH